MDMVGLGGWVLCLNKLGGNGITEDVLPLELFSCEEGVGEYVLERGARSFLNEMARSPEWNKVEYSTPLAQSFALSQDIAEANLKSERECQRRDDRERQP